MYEPNVRRVLGSLSSSDVVLDIGGWACPFNRANFVLDAAPFETRGFYRTFGAPPSQGGDVEHFTPDTWIVRDICDREPFPFRDKEIDFVICSHTLEDIRDPLWVCSEMIRIAKAGYIEVPSRAAESSRGWEHPRMAGLSHHRWLIDIEGESIRFFQKLHTIHTHWKYSLPASYLRKLPESRRVQWLFWTDSFRFREEIINGPAAQAAELEGFVQRTYPYSATRLRAGRIVDSARSFAGRVSGKIRRTIGTSRPSEASSDSETHSERAEPAPGAPPRASTSARRSDPAPPAPPAHPAASTHPGAQEHPPSGAGR